MLIRVYNYPWSGRLGNIAKQCVYCGEAGSRFRISSRAFQCCNCPNKTDEPIPELMEQVKKDYERLAREWCLKNGMDYDTVVKEMWEKYGGPPNQEKKNELRRP
jgi:hypothetical protein